MAGHGGRLRHVAWDAEMSGRGGRQAGAGDVQVDSAARREIRWGAGAREGGYDIKFY